MKTTVVHIADISWTARIDKARRTVTLSAHAGAITITAAIADVKRERASSINVGGITLHDKNAEAQILELYRFCHYPMWPRQDSRPGNLRLIRDELENSMKKPNHAAP